MSSHIFSMEVSSIEASPYMTDIENNSKKEKPDRTILGIHHPWKKVGSSYRKTESEEKWHEEKNPIKSGIIEKPFRLVIFHKILSLEFSHLRILYREILYSDIDDFSCFFACIVTHITYVEIDSNILFFRKSMDTHMRFSEEIESSEGSFRMAKIMKNIP